MDWIAFLLTMTGLYLNIKRNNWCWLVWISGNLFWLGSSIPHAQWAIMSQNVIFLASNGLGWYKWTHDAPVKSVPYETHQFSDLD